MARCTLRLQSIEGRESEGRGATLVRQDDGRAIWSSQLCRGPFALKSVSLATVDSAALAGASLWNLEHLAKLLLAPQVSSYHTKGGCKMMHNYLYTSG